MKVTVEVSLGELVDKMSILLIKTKKIEDPQKAQLAQAELDLLKVTLEGLDLKGLEPFSSQLYEINSKLWEIEDDIRDKEQAKDFGEDFIKLARSVYVTNDQRFAIKKAINEKFGSNIQEVKSYQSYD